jgi:hypothetical protein
MQVLKGVRLLFVSVVGIAMALLVLGLFYRGNVATVKAAQRPTERFLPLLKSVNEAPVIGTVKVLYEGKLGGTPDSQGFTYLPFGPATQGASGGVTTLTTTFTRTTQAGYTGSQVPTLDSISGYTLRFSLQVISETHQGSDRNGDGLDDRAGFSVIAISSDGQYGLELDFWTDRIWVQEDGNSQPPAGDLFTQAEGVAFDTTTGLIPYELTLRKQRYSLVVKNSELLSGTLRDYTPFNGFPDVYEIPNFIFMGDNTRSAQAIVKLAYVSVITEATPPDRSVAANTPLLIEGLGVMDVDAAGQEVVAQLAVQKGRLTLSTAVPNGLTPGQIAGNGSKTVVITGTLAQINQTLAFSPALTYRSSSGLTGTDIVSFSLNDGGHSGSGGPLSDRKQFNVFIKSEPEQAIYLPLTLKNYHLN